jgi:geranylgeranyl pyrophosphate synthase
MIIDLDLGTYVAARGRLVDDALEAALPSADAPPQILHRAMRHSVLSAGKRLRPMLVLASAEACGAEARDVLPVACAVELIHTYSLIHDDLPAMDDAATRRGRPTCHVAFGEAIAVLAGDALHALAFSLITEAAHALGPERAVAVSREIAGAIGTGGMVGGQVLDLLAEGRSFPNQPPRPERPLAEMVREIHLRKTAALIRACARAGGILAGADAAALDALSAYGDRIGLAFQIIDDVLDVVGDAATLGKHAGRDATKATYPAAFGVMRSRDIARQLTDDAVHAVAPLGGRGRILRDLAVSLLDREH